MSNDYDAYESFNLENVDVKIKEHKFFSRDLENNLEFLSKNLKENFSANEIVDADVNVIKSKNYNIFNNYNLPINNLFWAARDMVIEACEYYDLDYFKQKYYIRGWFDSDSTKVQDMIEWKNQYLAIPFFNGHYVVDGEDSEFFYKLPQTKKILVNKNNRVYLSEMVTPFTEKNSKESRQIIWFDVLPLEYIQSDYINIWIPL